MAIKLHFLSEDASLDDKFDQLNADFLTLSVLGDGVLYVIETEYDIASGREIVTELEEYFIEKYEVGQYIVYPI